MASTKAAWPRRMAWALLLAGLPLGLLAVWAFSRQPGSATASATSSPAATPGPVVDFTVEDLAGNEVHLADLRGQVVLVNFWATWCLPCREEMPVLEAYYTAQRERGFTLVGVNVGDDAKTAAAWIAENGYTFPVWSDPPGDTLIDLRIRGLPASILVDEEGRRLQRWLGPLTPEMLEEAITPRLP